MESKDKIITVFGATGQQGGSVATSLLATGWQVRAVVRDTGTEKAKTLLNLGAEIVRGDFKDRQSIRAAVAGTHGVLVFNPALSRESPMG